MGFLSFNNWQFAAAGAVCAAGPIIIHLLNRRRYRVVQWAAMDFLRQALKRNRRILQIRDIVLLVLRTLAVLLFGMALARPYFARNQERFDERQPLHAVIVIDNSLSMAYESLEGSVLRLAKERARALIEQLPSGSRISLIAACGSKESLSHDPYDSKDAAYEALEKIEIVDRSAMLTRIANEVRRACDDAPELAKRVVFISDQQELNWRDLKQSEALKSVPPMQVVAVGPMEWENSWIADCRVQDGVADIETPATVIVEIRHRGASPRRDVQVTLSVGDSVVGQKTVTIEQGLGTRAVDFECLFSTLAELPEPGKPVFVPIRASISPDRLAADDERFVAVPVVAALPVVFVDQYGPEQEDIVRGRLGETRHLRKLLAPKTSRSDAPRQLISVRHITPAELTRDMLADARLVVVAGLREPGEMAPLLADYIQQGGQLVLAAGADFDPAAWQEAAWLDGAGILPLPLKPEPIGQIPEAAGENLRPFALSIEGLVDEDYFQIAGVNTNELKDLYAEPLFFKAVEVDAAPQALEALRQREIKRLAEPASDRNSMRWLLWAADEPAETAIDSLSSDPALAARRIEALAARHLPRVLARYELPGKPPFLTARRIGKGEVIFCSTGLLSSWNTLPKTNAILIFDRILRGMLQSTLPQRNLQPTEQFVLPLPHEEQNLQVTMTRPGQQMAEPLDVSYVAAEQRGVIVTGLLERGVYRISGLRTALAPEPAAAPAKVWDVPLAVGGSSDESDLTPLARAQFEEIAASGSLSWVAPGEAISLAGTAFRGQRSWWWLALAALLLLLVEMSVLVWPSLPRQTSSPAGT